MIQDFSFALPLWTSSIITQHSQKDFSSAIERMSFVLDLVAHNIAHKTGGPFGAAIFDVVSNELISYGVNLVTSVNCSVLHAEIVAIMLAQKKLGTFNLSFYGSAGLELVTSTEPCAMCLGAIPWSGIKAVICGALDVDARAAGFDEGDKPTDWVLGSSGELVGEIDS